MKSLFKKIKKASPLNIIISISGIMLLLTISILFGYSISTGGLIVANSKQVSESYYLIEIENFEKFADASNFSKTLQTEGGAGFIRYDEGFRVFSSAYITLDDAKSVLNKMSNYKNAKIYTVNLSSFNNDNGLDAGVNKVIKNNIIAFKYCIENLSSLLNRYDKNEIDEIKFKENLVLIKEEVEVQIDKFLDVFSQSSTMYKYKSYIYEFLDEINKMLTLDLTGSEFSSVCHYSQISLIYCLDKILQLV